MALDFPLNPTNGQAYENYYYDSSITAWRSAGSKTGVNQRVTTLESQVIPITSGTINYANMPAGSVLQVVSYVLKTTTSASVSANSFTDVSGLSISITPKSTSSTIFVTYNLPVGASSTTFLVSRIMRGATAIGVGTGGSALNVSSMIYIEDNGRIATLSGSVLDSPATTSATTYKIQYGATGPSTIYANRRGGSGDFVAAATITALEIAG
jgi:hypothetical protein